MQDYLYLITTDSFIFEGNNRINTEFEINNSLLVNTVSKITHLGNAQRFGKYYPLESVDILNSDLYISAIRQHFNEEEYFDAVVSKLLSISDI